MVEGAGCGGDESIQTGLCGADEFGRAGQSLCGVDAEFSCVFQRLAGRPCLFRRAGELGVEFGDGVSRVLHVTGGFIECSDRFGFGLVFGSDGFVSDRVDDFGKHLGHGGHKSGVDRAVHGGCADVGDFGRDGAGFLVDVVLEGGFVFAAGHHTSKVIGEILGNHDGGIGFAGFDLAHCFGLGNEGPAELVVVFKLVDDLAAKILFADQGVVGAGVVVGHGDGDAVGVAVWIPEADDVVPGIQRRNEHHAEHDHPGCRHCEQAREVALENLQDVAH